MQCLPDVFATWPVVYLVGREYQIMVPVHSETLMWVRVGNEEFYDDVNGILRSSVKTHRMTVPAEKLDQAGKYTICFRRVIDRTPYYPKTSDIEEIDFCFKPVRENAEAIHVYHIADAHNRIKSPVAAGSYFGKELDLLILNGDIADHSGEENGFNGLYEIAGTITHGEIPVVFSRGNHDMRGRYAEKLVEHVPVCNGKSYYTFRAGPLWGLVLDVGEDKLDSSEEYGHTICCHDFRKKETEFLRSVVLHADQEYAAPDVKYRMVIAHYPFFEGRTDPKFNIEREIYEEWCRMLRENVHPQVLLFGHNHHLYVSYPGKPDNASEIPCAAVVASLPQENPDLFAGAGLVFSQKGIEVLFTDQDKKVLEKTLLPL